MATVTQFTQHTHVVKADILVASKKYATLNIVLEQYLIKHGYYTKMNKVQ